MPRRDRPPSWRPAHNTNRLIHGRYSRRLPRDLTAPRNPRFYGDYEFEIDLARVRLARLVAAQGRAPREHWLSYERAVLNYLGRITSLIAAVRRRRQLGPDLLTFLEDLRSASDSLDLPPSDHSNLIRTSLDGSQVDRN
jgi:hypothetical protein